MVKGQLCSRLYPQTDHRISADDDLLIPDGEFMACHEQLLTNGLTTDTPADELASADEVSYTKRAARSTSSCIGIYLILPKIHMTN